MNIESAFQKIEENIANSFFSGNISDANIEKAERKLQIKFPESLRRFLRRFGSGSVNGFEFFGIISDPDIDKPMIPNMVWITEDLRSTASLPNSYIVVGETGMGEYYVIDTSFQNSQSENPILIWNYGGGIEKIAEDFPTFILSVL